MRLSFLEVFSQASTVACEAASESVQIVILVENLAASLVQQPEQDFCVIGGINRISGQGRTERIFNQDEADGSESTCSISKRAAI